MAIDIRNFTETVFEMAKRFVFIILIIVLVWEVSSAQTDSIHSQQTVMADIKSTAHVPWYEHKATPWIVSLSIAVISVIINLIISITSRRTTLAVAARQIDNSINLAKVQFQSSLNSKNLQDWINEVRNCISEFATHARQYNIELQAKEPNTEKRFQLQEKVYFNRSKLRLLVKPSLPTHSAFLKAENEFMYVLEIHLLNANRNINDYNNQKFHVLSSEMLERGREMLYDEWHKIQHALVDDKLDKKVKSA